MNLDAVREALKRHEGDYNRGWNMALLTLMQRARVIQVRAVAAPGDQPGGKWDVEILRPEILHDRASAAWDVVFETRQRERSAARAELTPFETLMLHPTRECVTRAVFELIEPHAFAPPCGRCPSCRERKIEPPERLPCGGLETAWPSPIRSEADLPGGLILLEPKDASFTSRLKTLLERLAFAGIEQFIMPGQLAREAAKILANAAELGLILSAEEMMGETAIAALPTALLLPGSPLLADFLLTRMRAFSAKWRSLPIIIVAEPERIIDGRRLDQTVSSSAPISEDVLDQLARTKAETV